MTNIQEHNFPLEEAYEPKRRPTIWNEDEDIVHIGPPGAMHGDLAWEADVPYRNTGYVMVDKDGDPTDIGSYDVLPSTVERAVKDHFKAPQQQSWDFEAAADEPEIIEPEGGEDWSEKYKLPDLVHRRPFVYWPDSNKVFVGIPGQFHENLHQVLRNKHSDDWEDALNQGRIRNPYLSAPDKQEGYVTDINAPSAITDAGEPGAIGLHGQDDARGHPAVESLVRRFGEGYYPDREVPSEFETFSKTADSMPEIQQHDFQPKSIFDGDRRPTIYDADTHTIHVGPLGGFHSELSRRAQIPYKNTGYLTYRGDKPVGVGSYVPAHQPFENYLKGYFGVEPENDNDAWAFEAANEHDLQWQEGTPGKGWVLDDGKVRTWTVDQESRPYHMHKYRRDETPLRNEKGHSIGAFQIMPNGQVHRLGDDVNPEALAHIQAADPRLYTDQWEGPSWQDALRQSRP
jgi:hypothetical protein